MVWIKTILPEQATGQLKNLYGRVTGPEGRVDNILMSHSLRPHTLEGHMALYKAVLHYPDNELPKWLLETIGVYVSMLNGCAYCVEHHFAGLLRLLRDEKKANHIRAALEIATKLGDQVHTSVLDSRQLAALGYAEKLTRAPANMTQVDIENLRNHGFVDGEILEINQVSAYFSYANRTVLGLGCCIEGDVLGLSPNNQEDRDDWGHQ